MGYEILKETLDKEAERQERAQHAKLSEKELKEIARRNVCVQSTSSIIVLKTGCLLGSIEFRG